MDRTTHNRKNYFAQAIAQAVAKVVDSVTKVTIKADEGHTTRISEYLNSRKSNTGAVVVLGVIGAALIIAVTLKKN